MVDLYHKARRTLTGPSAVEALSGRSDGTQSSATLSAVDYALPVVVDALHSRAGDSTGIVELLNRLRVMDVEELGTDAMWHPASDRAVHGDGFVDLLFEPGQSRSGRKAVVAKLAERARVTDDVAATVLSASCWTVCGLLSKVYGPAIDRHRMLDALGEQRRRLSGDGWDPWIRAVESERTAVMAGSTARIPPPPAPRIVPEPRPARYPPPVRRPARQPRASAGPAGIGAYPPPDRSRSRLDTTGSGAGRSEPNRRRDELRGQQPARHRPLTQGGVVRHTRPRVEVADPPAGRRWLPVGLALLGLLVLAGLGYWLLGRSGDSTDDSTTAVGAGLADGNLADDPPAQRDGSEAGAEPAGAADAGSGDGGVAAPTGSTISQTTRLTMDVPMTDTFGGSDARGTINLEFVPFTGEICFDVRATGLRAPFDGHIHAGTAGEKGGIVVDFGALEDAATGCLQNEPNDIQAVLADPAAYYAEMHDPSAGGADIRGQLSEAINIDDPDAVLGRPLPGDDVSSTTDPDGGGALIEVEGGSIILQGAVADEAMAQQVRDLLAGVDLGDVPIDDRLVVESGAPLPSGRIVVSDAIFFEIGSSDLSQDTGVLDLLARIFEDRPAWSMTIVGHTDSTGDDVTNLELSLARADAVRAALVDRGVDAMSLKIRGAGATEPRADNATLDGRRQNRRIEFEVEVR